MIRPIQSIEIKVIVSKDYCYFGIYNENLQSYDWHKKFECCWREEAEFEQDDEDEKIKYSLYVTLYDKNDSVALSDFKQIA